MEEDNARYKRSAEMFREAQNIAGFKRYFQRFSIKKIVNVSKRTTFKSSLTSGQFKPKELILTFYIMYLYNHIFNYDSRFDSC